MPSCCRFQRFDLFHVGDVDGVGQDVDTVIRAGRANRRFGLVQALHVPIGDTDVEAAPREAFGGRSADACRAADHHRDAPRNQSRMTHDKNPMIE